jgi:hypothetical protein
MAHSLVLVRNQVAKPQAANEAATCRKSHKRKQIQQEGTLIVSEGVHLTTLNEFNAVATGREQARRVALNQALSLEDAAARVARQGTTHGRARMMRKVP